ncbi:MAG: diacylglycerol kinase [Candidatus Magasanikbacteria bacterium CG10_big_fil_rev_8_21_14_0_10_43_6]|uniref:Diacylglycerol kinase n=1 Tax=Candidatus Magasanikbacteria bacterium CG10_big_fil_rev_8_21_14_0_10_43_6 TaxID=1974650 RepID=A0A2M6W1Y0_9BACT|nr:MAG: diacylglycerol kinase [Candidatus Magasanikbacteria bacterium CG10_big_fil_rev_8_21_14_0_10_43_6]
MSIKRFIGSFKDASRGVRYAFSHEQNFRIQIYTAIFILLVSLVLSISKGDLVVVLLLITLVLLLELLNTAVEKMLDLLKPRMSLHVEVIKDVMAAVVLTASLCSLIVGIIIFYPYLVELFLL